MPKHTKSAAGEAQETPDATPATGGNGSKRTAAEGARDSGADSAAASAAAIARGRPVAERKKKYLVAPRTAPGGAFGVSSWAAPLGLSAVQQALNALPDIDVVDTIATRGGMAPAGFGPASMGDATDGVVVARMTDQKAGELLQRGQGQLLVERDQHLELLDPMLRRPDLVSSLTPYQGPQAELLLAVVGSGGAPLPEVEVSLFGGALPSTAVTGPDGVARLRLYGEDAHTISGLYVKPRTDYWSLYQRDPDLSLDEPNVVMLRPLADWPALRGMPQQSAMGWGARAMRLDQVPQQFRGRGVKVAVIDSGAATTHDNLNQIRAGFDVINKKVDRSTWNVDTLGHGSHCAGVIAAADPAWGIRGFAPEAEIHVCKLFPGGQVSQLIDALEYCIEQGIDVVNMSLGGSSPSEALERQIVRAKQAGVACIAAAGNSAAAVQYPGSSPHVLAVAAIGKIGEFPPDSYHAETIGSDVDMQGYFTARFSCFGPQVDVCAPGVAVVSSVPPNNFAAWDGTSMAAPHVTGLAALVLAHRPEFQSMALPRSPERVERLFQVLRMSARPVTLSDPNRIGYGLPDALVALGLPVAQPGMAWQAVSAGFGIPAGMFAAALGDGARMGMGMGMGVGTGPAGTNAPGQAVAMQYPFGGLRPSGW
ncbi:S8 family serine peptidase [Telluria beijingensis]|uniref:S8 family serine peptidase n=1 Tax=Telluria beijingensis TaxID=3068633 RepID=UPI0027957BF6|nr:S8 family serine peptidase [Massilia sp. REN29]